MARRRVRRHWGSGSVYQTAGGWGIRWREKGRRRRRGGFVTREDAERVLAKVQGEIAMERAGMPPDLRGLPVMAVLGDEWIERRKLTHRAWRDDRSRWRRHLRPFFGRNRAAEVDAAAIRAFVELKLSEGLDPATVGHCVRLLSTMFSELTERPKETGATANPVRALPRSTRRLFRARHDARDTPFIEKLDDVRRVFQALPEPINVAFAVGAFGGLRTGEVLGLSWEDVDFDARLIRVRVQVQDSRIGPLKDEEARDVPIQAAVLPVLTAYKLKTGGAGLMFPPDRPGRRAGRNGTPSKFMRPQTLHAKLKEALADCRLPIGLTWYQSTRHTLASQWVLAGGSMEKLAAVLGHSSTEVTRRYAHLKPELFPEADRRSSM